MEVFLLSPVHSFFNRRSPLKNLQDVSQILLLMSQKSRNYRKPKERNWYKGAVNVSRNFYSVRDLYDPSNTQNFPYNKGCLHTTNHQ